MNAVLLALALLGAPPDAADRELSRRIDAELQRHGGALAEAHVDVTVRGRRVLLHGTVRLYRQKMVYEQVAWRMPGVREVESELRVVPRQPVSDAEIQRRIIELAKLDRFQGTELQSSVQRGAVAVQAVFHDPTDVFLLKHRLAEIEGVRDIAIIASFAV